MVAHRDPRIHVPCPLGREHHPEQRSDAAEDKAEDERRELLHVHYRIWIILRLARVHVLHHRDVKKKALLKIVLIRPVLIEALLELVVDAISI